MLVVDGNSVYEIDEECISKRQISKRCGIPEEWLPHAPVKDKMTGKEERNRKR